jgi:hypothetical protein
MRLIINCADGVEITEEISEKERELNVSAALSEAWLNLRAERNALLSRCDWTVLTDTPTSTAAWKTYRQALRDLPANTTDPSKVVWPTPPT